MLSHRCDLRLSMSDTILHRYFCGTVCTSSVFRQEIYHTVTEGKLFCRAYVVGSCSHRIPSATNLSGPVTVSLSASNTVLLLPPKNHHDVNSSFGHRTSLWHYARCNTKTVTHASSFTYNAGVFLSIHAVDHAVRAQHVMSAQVVLEAAGLLARCIDP